MKALELYKKNTAYIKHKNDNNRGYIQIKNKTKSN